MTTFYSILHPQYTFQRPTFVDVDGEQVPKYKDDQMTYCRKIRIPIIQRDYAEGRPNASNKRKITNFLKQMLDVIYGTKQTTSLDFIYGYVQDESGKKCNMQEWEEVNDIRFAFEPLDGQQRLTTLFLLYWILGREKDLIDKRDQKSLFAYSTRESSSDFCNVLVFQKSKEIIANWKKVVEIAEEKNAKAKELRKKETNKYQAVLQFPQETIPSLNMFIKNQEWFKWNWRTDPTICSMLNVLDLAVQLIEKDTRGGFEVACSKNKNLENIHFSILDELDCNGQMLFVKMNARGKELSEFDLVKSELEEEFEKQVQLNITTQSQKQVWTSQMDGDWLDYCWHKITEKWDSTCWDERNVTSVEDYLLKFVKRMTATLFFDKRRELIEVMEAQKEDTTKQYIQELINAVYERSNYSNNIIHAYEDYIDEMRKHNISKQNNIVFEQIIKGIDSLLYKDDQGKWHDIDDYTNSFGFTILKDYIQHDNIDYLTRLQFYALILFTKNIANTSDLAGCDSKVENLVDWLRFVLHMFRNENRTQRIDDQDAFEYTINELDQFVKSWSKSSKTFNEYISDAPHELFTTEPDRYKEEQLKAKLKLGQSGNGTDWKEYLNSLETRDTNHMLGQYYAPLEWSKENDTYNLELFKDYTQRLYLIFEKGSDDIKIKCMLSLLNHQDYLFSSQKNDFASLRNFNASDRDFSWKRFLRDGQHTMFKDWLDCWKASGFKLDELAQFLDSTINQTKVCQTDWRFYLLHISVDSWKKLFTRIKTNYRNIRLCDNHPYLVHTKTQRGDKQYDIVMVYLVDQYGIDKYPNVEKIDYNNDVLSNCTELKLETKNGKCLKILNYHDNHNQYHIQKDNNDMGTCDIDSMINHIKDAIKKV